MTLRSAVAGDRHVVVALRAVEEASWFGEPAMSAEEIGEWIDDEGGMADGVVAVADRRRVRGFASPGRRQAMFLADPSVTDTVVDDLLPWLRGQREVVELMTFAGDTARARAFERHGLQPTRSSFLMARPESAGPVSAAALPNGVEVAPYRFGDDDDAVHRLIYVDAAWTSVPGHRARDL